MPDPLPQFNQSIIPSDSTIVIGLSGGPDSMYLLHRLAFLQKDLNITIIAAHLDHEWQESSKIAVKLCQDSCDQLGIKLIVKKLSELKFDVKWNGSQEELGRKLRRYFFESITKEYKAKAIVLAHHLQDQQETFFIRLIRGSSIQGLTGMDEIDGLYIRPLLECSKHQIINYLDTQKITYYTDPTNISDQYLRNRIRNYVIPVFHLIDSRFEQNLAKTMHHLTLVEKFLEQQTLELLQKIKTNQGIKIISFLQINPIIQQRILLNMLIEQNISFTPSQNLFKEIMRFLEKSSSSRHTIYKHCCIEKNKTYFTMKRIEKSNKNL